MRIRTRLLVVVLGVWMAAAAGFGLLTWNLHKQKTEADLQQVRDFADGVSALVELELDKRALLARTLASSRAVRDGDFARFHEEAVVATEGTGDWALLVEPQLLRANSLAPFAAEPLPRSLPQPLTQAGTSILFVPKGSVSGAPVVTVMVPVPRMTPQRYNVGVSFEPSRFQQLFMGPNMPSAAVTSIVDRHQVIMARSRDPELWVGRSASPAFKKRIEEGGVGFATSTTLDGTPSLTYLTRPNAYGWSVVVAIPRAHLTAAAWAASTKAMAVSGALLLLLLVSALLGARAITSAVDRLSRAAADLGCNRVPEPLASGVREFDDVALALHEAGVKAQEATGLLERRVEEAVRAEADAQARLLQGQKLELVGRLSAGVAHDFNNLLQTITTAQQFLKARVDGEREQRMLSAAARATSKAADLVKQMMMLGRVQALEPRPVHIADAILKGHELTSKAVGPGISLTADITPGLPPVFVDAAQFDMALLNLVFNARDAMPSGGSIRVSAHVPSPQELEAAPLRGAGYVCVAVSDNGAGMTAETQTQAFEPFFTTKPVGAGTGLGLAQVHAFATQSGGSIQLTSEPGRGTRVSMLLPVAPQTPAAAQEAGGVSLQASNPRSLSVLMVEDDALVVSVVAAALRSVGHRVQACHSADEAVEVLRTGASFDVLFSDVVMPGSMNGVELIHWARQLRPDLAAVVATGYADNVSTLSVPVIRKPYDFDTLQRVLDEVVALQPG
ncbi:ATP-binding protein [Roseateles sp. DC23W]|uniref:histidine kinase n=1 Tax=Pelomonas dachongensis TaxID=3299029 RepID=A0ABW7ER68_9BURK